jgi:hypothetical protein
MVPFPFCLFLFFFSIVAIIAVRRLLRRAIVSYIANDVHGHLLISSNYCAWNRMSNEGMVRLLASTGM